MWSLNSPVRLIKQAAGGMADVKIVEDKAGFVVALKRNRSDRTMEPAVRHTIEFLISTDLGRHPNIVGAWGTRRFQGAMYTAFDYVDGPALSQYVNNRQLSLVEAAGLLFQVCQGMAYLWKRARLVHLDLKPENILVDRAGTAKVGDFGVARSAGVKVTPGTGTAAWMAPEQFDGGEADPRMDVYSFGLIAYRLLLGHHPLGPGPRGADRSDVRGFYRKLHKTATPMRIDSVRRDAPTDLVDFFEGCVAKDSSSRPADFSSVLNSLRELLSDLIPLRSSSRSGYDQWLDWISSGDFSRQSRLAMLARLHTSGGWFLNQGPPTVDFSRYYTTDWKHPETGLSTSDEQLLLAALDAIRRDNIQVAASKMTALANTGGMSRLGPFAYSLHAFCMFATDHKAEAVSSYDEILRVNPWNSRTLFMTAILQDDLGEREDALERLEKALRIDYAFDRAWSVMAFLRSRQEDFTVSGEALQMALVSYPNSPAAQSLGQQMIAERLRAEDSGVCMVKGRIPDIREAHRRARKFWKENLAQSATCDTCGATVSSGEGGIISVSVIYRKHEPHDDCLGTPEKVDDTDLVCEGCLNEQVAIVLRLGDHPHASRSEEAGT